MMPKAADGKHIFLQAVCVQVKFTGVNKNVEQLYMDCSIYFQPSIMESHGIAVQGAMYFKKPCVVSDRQGLPESVINNVTGIVVPVKNTTPAAEAIILLLTDAEKAMAFGKAGKQKQEKDFNKTKWTGEMDIIFNAVNKKVITQATV